ncbi:MAG TPA: toll/interleukin-1 receptor domain-containing protein [Nitrospiraceae bacterium]|nr:toll/interleukin-1 receptor domain-containing protein [Nitrospiraceae bacterium]
MDAFMSHASKDVAVVAQIDELLEADGLKVWVDRSEIRLGVLLRKELQHAIRNSRMLILLWSKAAARSRWVAADGLLP